MMGRLISKFRIWHFAYTCRHDSERIGFELCRLLIERRGPVRQAQALNLMLAEREGTFSVALGAVAAYRWKITDHAAVNRIFESLNDEQQDRIYASVSSVFDSLWRRG